MHICIIPAVLQQAILYLPIFAKGPSCTEAQNYPRGAQLRSERAPAFFCFLYLWVTLLYILLNLWSTLDVHQSQEPGRAPCLKLSSPTFPLLFFLLFLSTKRRKCAHLVFVNHLEMFHLDFAAGGGSEGLEITQPSLRLPSPHSAPRDATTLLGRSRLPAPKGCSGPRWSLQPHSPHSPARTQRPPGGPWLPQAPGAVRDDQSFTFLPLKDVPGKEALGLD